MFIRKAANKTSSKSKNRNSSKKNLVSKKNSYYKTRQISQILPSLIIFSGFIALSFAIFILIKQINPVIKNERLKYLCTYELGNKKNKLYNKKTKKLKSLVGDSKKFCRDFIFPRDKRKSRINFFPLIKDILFRFIF